MLIIRRAQQDALEQDVQERFASDLATVFRDFYPEDAAALGEAGVRARIQQARKKAESHQIVSEAGILRYLCLVQTLGADFDQEPWAQAILSDAGRSEPDKLDDLYREVYRRQGVPDEEIDRHFPSS